MKSFAPKIMIAGWLKTGVPSATTLPSPGKLNPLPPTETTPFYSSEVVYGRLA
jgi:hypothetical protein